MLMSRFKHNRVKVETSEGTVEGVLKHIDVVRSHRKGNYYSEGTVILENNGKLIIVKKWICVKSGFK